jgi:membrane-associated PAP2 superfamily phosphatase
MAPPPAVVILPSWTVYRRRWLPELLILLAVAVVGGLIFQWRGLDLELQRPFFSLAPARPWQLGDQAPWVWLYRLAPMAAAVPAVAALVAVVLARRRPPGCRRCLYSWAVLLTFLLGPGIVVNLLLKDRWIRPRPVSVREFGGLWQYRAPIDLAPVEGRPLGGQGKSFPCGHASVGFALAIFYFLFRRRRPALAWSFLALAIVLGLTLGIGRMVAGAHFASDVFWSGILVGLTAWLVYYPILNVPGREETPPGSVPAAPRRRMEWAAAGAAVAVVALAALGTPHSAGTHYRRAEGAPTPAEVVLRCSHGDVEVNFDEAGPWTIDAQTNGSGLAGSRARHQVREVQRGGRTAIEYDLTDRGFFRELATEVRIHLSRPGLSRVIVEMDRGNVFVRGVGAPPNLEIRVRDGEVVLPAAWIDAGVAVRAPRVRSRSRD